MRDHTTTLQSSTFFRVSIGVACATGKSVLHPLSSHSHNIHYCSHVRVQCHCAKTFWRAFICMRLLRREQQGAKFRVIFIFPDAILRARTRTQHALLLYTISIVSRPQNTWCLVNFLLEHSECTQQRNRNVRTTFPFQNASARQRIDGPITRANTTQQVRTY